MSVFRDRVVLITGAASGIGRQLALLLAAEGAKIAALDLQAQGLESLQTELVGRTFVRRTVDVTDLSALRQVVRDIEGQIGATDIVIASAGLGRGTPAAAWRAEDVNSILNVNLLGVVNTVDAVLPGMRQRRTGHFVVMSSLASYRGLPHMAAYSASKAACNTLCDSLRVELAGDGIAVSCVCPGWINTPMTQAIGIPSRLMMSLDDAALQIREAIRSRRKFVAFPLISAWQVWLLRSLPRPLGDWLAGLLLRKIRSIQSKR
ncbi:MAG: SDR family NAD(P)-dependent oxidoreductase [Planctomycetia bacterium]|nr:SDR family NAD(P)-dependent oxidoreductase [Planctomycetia bacterium]